MDGEILKGVGSLKVYRDFVSFYDLLPPRYTTGMIGHTRHATFGVHTEENAHPFGFGTLKVAKAPAPVYAFVGVHNGTLLNHTSLASTGNLKVTKEITEEFEEVIGGKKVKKTRTKTVSKIDSEILLERLYTDKNYSVLSEYNGAAALMWQDVAKPNTMFFYHGKSCKTEYDSEIVEERPLYYWKENKNSLYVSSLIDSLYVIGGDEKSIGEFQHNVVYEIKDGNISKAKKTKIDRSKNWKTKAYGGHNSCSSVNRHHNVNNFNNTNVRNKWQERNSTAYKATPVTSSMSTSAQLQLNLEVPVDKGLLAETFDHDPNQNNGLTMCKQLRYWRNGHLANGVYMYITNKGFFHLGHYQKSALESVKGYAGKYFWNGEFHDKVPDINSMVDYCQPIDLKRGKRNAMSFLYYIFNGVRMKTYTDWQAAQENSIKGRVKFDVISLSIGASHPIIDLESKTDKRVAGAYYEGTLANTTYAFLGSNKLYTFTSGQIKNISYIPGFEPTTFKREIPEVNTLDRAAAFLDKNLKINGYTTLKKKDLLRELVSLDKVIDEIKVKGENKIKIVSEAIEEKINTIVLEQVTEPVTDYAIGLSRLEQYKSGSTKAALACNILTNLLKLEVNE